MLKGGFPFLFIQVGAAYGPMLQDLREFLEENPDCAVAPEWAEMVQSSVSTLNLFTAHVRAGRYGQNLLS